MRSAAIVALVVAFVTAINVWLFVAAQRDAPSDEQPPASVEELSRSVEYQVEERVLSRVAEYPASVVVIPAEQFEVPLSGSGTVTTTWLEEGETLRPGMPVVEIDGMPVFALDIPFELYRDLTPGLEGRDVEALQGALNRAMSLNLVVDGKYGPATQHAVEQLYASAGAEPVRVTGSDVGLSQLIRDVESVNRLLEAAKSAATADDAGIADLTAQLAAADERLREAYSSVGPVVLAGSIARLEEPASVVDILVSTGDRLDSRAIFTSSDAVVYAEFEAPVGDVGRLGPGSQVAAVGRPEATLTVVEVAQSGISATVTLEVVAGLLPSDSSLVVEFIAASTDDPVPVVPAGFIFVDDLGQSSILVKDGDDTVPQAVELGLVVGGLVEITGPNQPSAGAIVVAGS